MPLRRPKQLPPNKSPRHTMNNKHERIDRMKTIAITAFMTLLLSGAALAQIPRTINYQGRAADATGPIQNESRRMTLRIYDNTGQQLFAENQTVAFRAGGVFTVAIGDSTTRGIPTSVRFDEQYFLGVTIAGFNGGKELPRIPLRSVPYSFHAAIADALETPAVLSGNSSSSPTLYVVANPADASSRAIVSNGVDSTSEHYIAAAEAGDNTPDAGGYYRDNAPVAWAAVDFNGLTIEHFGVEDVQYRSSDTSYVITLKHDLAVTTTDPSILAVAPTITPGGISSQSGPVISQWGYDYDPFTGQIKANTIVVSFIGLFTRRKTQSPFAVHVFGRIDN